MAFIEAKTHLQKYGLDDRVIVFEMLTDTVKAAADALKSTEGEIAKSLAFFVHENPILVIVAGDKRIDNVKFKTEFGVKAKMISHDDVEEVIGHYAGGVCPFGVKENVKVYLDESLKVYEYVYPACGDHNSAVKLTIDELCIASNFIKWVNVCK